MALEVFVSDLQRRIESAPTPRLAAGCAKVWLQQSLADGDFVHDLCEFLIDGFAVRLPDWRLASIPSIGNPEFHIRVLVWPPRYANEPHEHSAWTVAGVLLNRLDGVTLERTDAGHFKELRGFSGRKGDVGILDPPCIHRLLNPTDRTTVSLHVFAGRFDEAHGSRVGHSALAAGPDPYRMGLRHRTELAVIDILGQDQPHGHAALLDRLFLCGSAATKLAICQAIARTDPRRAARYLAELAEVVPRSAERLRDISIRIALSV